MGTKKVAAKKVAQRKRIQPKVYTEIEFLQMKAEAHKQGYYEAKNEPQAYEAKPWPIPATLLSTKELTKYYTIKSRVEEELQKLSAETEKWNFKYTELRKNPHVILSLSDGLF